MQIIRYKDIKVLPVEIANNRLFIQRATVCEYLKIKLSTFNKVAVKNKLHLFVDIDISKLNTVLPEIKPSTKEGRKFKSQFKELSKLEYYQLLTYIEKVEKKPSKYYEFSGVKLEFNNGEKKLTAGEEIKKDEIVALNGEGFVVSLGQFQKLPPEETLKLHKKIEDQQFEIERLSKICGHQEDRIINLDNRIKQLEYLNKELSTENSQLAFSVSTLKANLKTKEENIVTQTAFLQLTKSQKENLERQFRERTDKFKIKYNALKDLIKEIITDAR